MPGPGWRASRSTAMITERKPSARSSRCSRPTSRSISSPCWRWIWMLDWYEISPSSRTENTTKMKMNIAVRRTVLVRQRSAMRPTSYSRIM